MTARRSNDYFLSMRTIIILFVILTLSAGLVFARGAREANPQASGTAVAVTERQPLASERLAAIIAEQDPNTYLIDVRTEAEYRSGAIPSAINIPYDVIAENLPTDDRDARIIVYCRSGRRSSVADNTLADLGFTNVLDFGGVGNWEGDLEVGN